MGWIAHSEWNTRNRYLLQKCLVRAQKFHPSAMAPVREPVDYTYVSECKTDRNGSFSENEFSKLMFKWLKWITILRFFWIWRSRCWWEIRRTESKSSAGCCSFGFLGFRERISNHQMILNSIYLLRNSQSRQVPGPNSFQRYNFGFNSYFFGSKSQDLWLQRLYFCSKHFVRRFYCPRQSSALQLERYPKKL